MWLLVHILPWTCFPFLWIASDNESGWYCSGLWLYWWLFLVAQTVKRLPTTWETRVRSLGGEDLLEKEMATHSSTLAWKISWEKPGSVQSMGSQRVGHDWATSLHFTYGYNDFQRNQVFYLKLLFLSLKGVFHLFWLWNGEQWGVTGQQSNMKIHWDAYFFEGGWYWLLSKLLVTSY